MIDALTSQLTLNSLGGAGAIVAAYFAVYRPLRALYRVLRFKVTGSYVSYKPEIAAFTKKYRCQNCSSVGNATIPKGTLLIDAEATCRHCGVLGAFRSPDTKQTELSGITPGAYLLYPKAQPRS